MTKSFASAAALVLVFLLAGCAGYPQRRNLEVLRWGIAMSDILKQVPEGEDIERVLVDAQCVSMSGIAPIPDMTGAQIAHYGESVVGELTRLSYAKTREEWEPVIFWMRGRGQWSDCMGASIQVETSNAGTDSAGYCYDIDWQWLEDKEFVLKQRTSWNVEPTKSEVPLRMTPYPVAVVTPPHCGFSLQLRLDREREFRAKICENQKKGGVACRPR